MIFYLRIQKENPSDFVFSKDNDILPNIIFNKEIKISDNRFVYRKVFKLKNIGSKNNTKIIFFIGEEDKYIINLEIKKQYFIYDVDLKVGHKILTNIALGDIDQQKMEYHDKLDIFLEALKQNNEENKTRELYRETIELYLKKRNFSLLISLFTKIYQEKKLCELLIEIFYKTNLNNKENEKNDNKSDKNEKLQSFNSLMVKISLESDNLIKTYEYDPIKFYGIIFSYLNYYDYNNFQNFLNKLYKENCEILYEILIIYFSQFSNPIKNNEKDFFVNFIEFIISKKDFSAFTLGLSFINDMDIFIYVIDKTKEKIYNKYIKENIDKKNFIPIELKDNLVFKEETLNRLNDIIGRIISINKFSEEKRFILVNFKSDFWESILKEFRKINPNPKYFEVCSKLRNVFKEYDKFIKAICDKKKDKDIIQDIENYINIDEFAYVLNEKIKNYFELKKGKITNSEILGYIHQYNPYYKEEEYKHKRDSYILDFLNFDCDYNDEYAIMEHKRFIETFKKLDYEDIFKDNLLKFLDRMINKINNLSSFDTVINLIRIDKLQDKDKEYLEKLKNKFEQKIKTEIKKLNNDNLSKPVEIIAEFIKLIFIMKIIVNF